MSKKTCRLPWRVSIPITEASSKIYSYCIGAKRITLPSPEAARIKRRYNFGSHNKTASLTVEFRTEPKHRTLYVRCRVLIQQPPKLIFCSAVEFWRMTTALSNRKTTVWYGVLSAAADLKGNRHEALWPNCMRITTSSLTSFFLRWRLFQRNE